jgi:hypothetical protein
VILRILAQESPNSEAQESPNSEVQLKRYGEKNFGERNMNLERFWGHILKYRIFGGLMCKKAGV